jgi:hypothetical protein
MLTIFCTPKPFVGHINIIQRNAIKSWTLLHPEVEVILFGDEQGAAEVCQEFGLRHEPEVKRHEKGPKYLNYFFYRAQEIANHEVVCYVNCDIILMSDFAKSIARVHAAHEKFLMVGRRWDTDVTEPWAFERVDWEDKLRLFARQCNLQRSPIWIDYFAFSRGLYHQNFPPFVIGRPGWDPWLIWFANSSKVPVVDATPSVMAIHQNHDYSYHAKGVQGVGTDELAKRNYQLLGSWLHYHRTDSAPETLELDGLQRNWFHWSVPARQAILRAKAKTWFTLMDITRPIRHPLGLRQRAKSAGAVVSSSNGN